MAAIPTIAQDTLARLRSDADEWVVLIAPPHFRSVGEWYASFPQVADAEVAGILAQETANPEDPVRGMVPPDGAARMP